MVFVGRSTSKNLLSLRTNQRASALQSRPLSSAGTSGGLGFGCGRRLGAAATLVFLVVSALFSDPAEGLSQKMEHAVALLSVNILVSRSEL